MRWKSWHFPISDCDGGVRRPAWSAWFSHRQAAGRDDSAALANHSGGVFAVYGACVTIVRSRSASRPLHIVERSVFQHCALVSGLLTQADLDSALSSLGGSRVMSSKAISDDALAGKLVDMGRLNRWQAEQLRSGRSKFNLGLYQIIDSIGQGGMGQVFKGEHTIMGRVVAIKVLPRSRSTPEAIVSFMHEIRAQGQLDHENLVRAYDAGHDGNVYFFVTEYVPGTDLRRLIRAQGRMSMEVAASVITQAAKGLDHAHSRGLIHRDVKPGNLLVTPDGRTKVSDLGLAGWFKESEQTDAYGGKVVGTADYLAPEQITAPDKLAPAADVYSLGCTLYYATTCKVPFPGGTVKEKARAHCNTPPLDPRRLNPEMNDDFVEVIADMMAKQAVHRLQTMNDVIARLAPWVEGVLPQSANEVRHVAPTPPPIRIPAHLPKNPSRMADTEPYFLAEPSVETGQADDPSQASFGSQATHDDSSSAATPFNGLPPSSFSPPHSSNHSLSSSGKELRTAVALPPRVLEIVQRLERSPRVLAMAMLSVGLLIGAAIGYFLLR